MDDWADLGEAPPSDDEPEFEFTAFTTQTELHLTLHENQTTLEDWMLHQEEFNLSAQQVRFRDMLVQKRHLTMVAQQQHLEFTFQTPWIEGLEQRLIRYLRQHGNGTETELREHLRRWGGVKGGASLTLLLKREYTFVSCGPDCWTLTPWVKLRWAIPVHQLPHEHPDYVREASLFWLGRQQVPTEAEEWCEEVRLLVMELQHMPAIPPYFVPCARAQFQQISPFGVQDYRLDPLRLPDGEYFYCTEQGVRVLYRFESGQFLAESVFGTNVITPFATLRLKEALLSPAGNPDLEWQKEGRHFRDLFHACRLVVKGSR